ncbi:MAG TPA: lysophospholipid acyltransferase family protein [Flavobacteriales bacterium]|nr:lysophospholipid acyltransferase family protein [Flavobacteriales bacterium]
MFLPFRLLFKLWFALVFGSSMVLLYVPFRILLHKPSRYPAAFKLMKAWGHFLAWAGMVPLKVQREQPLPPPPYIVCINHASYLDIIHAFCLLPDYFLFMGKHELLEWPLFNIFFKDMHIAVNRGNGVEAARALMKAGMAVDQGSAVSIFPEGTISPDAPRMLPFKDGAFRLAVKKQVPVVPITFLDNWYLFGDPEKPLSWGRPGVARAVVHAPIPTAGLGAADVDALRQHVFEAIEAPLRKAYPEK